MKNKRKLKIILLVVLIVLAPVFIFLFVGRPAPHEDIVWGINFSEKHAVNLGLDWQELYLAILDDLGARHIKLAVHWDMIEPEKDRYFFDHLDKQVEEAEKRQAEVMLVMGMKTPRWPECHLPGWAHDLDKAAQQAEILKMIETVVRRYKDSPAIAMWQVENEPFFPFGDCPWTDINFLKKEVELVRSLDHLNRPIVISDTGEMSLWIRAARLGDKVGTTMYKKVWFHEVGLYVTYPFPPIFYYRKARLIDFLFNKEVICVELQAEPWGPKLLYDSPLDEQEKTMNLRQLQDNVDFARRTGLRKFYLWGTEWWYWMKVKHDQPEIWQEARTLFLN